MNNNNDISNEEYNYNKSRYLGLQMLATVAFIIALLISYLLSYDKKCSLENKKGLFSDKEAQNLALFQTILVFFIALTFLYVNFKQYDLSKKSNDGDEQDFLLQIETSIFAIISAVIGLYIIFKNYRKSTFQIPETELF